MENKMTELMLQFLTEEGYRPTIDDDGDIQFKCEGLTFLVLNEDNDQLFVRICLPSIYDVDENNRNRVNAACERVARDRKVIKAFVANDTNVWLAFEILADSSPELKDFVPRAIAMLKQGREYFYHLMSEDA